MISDRHFKGQYGTYIQKAELESQEDYCQYRIESQSGKVLLLREYDCLPNEDVQRNIKYCIDNKESFPNVCAVHDYFEQEGRFYIVQDYYLLTLKNLNHLNNKQQIIFDLLEAVEQLHKNKIAHREIKPWKIAIVDSKYKLVNFGKYHEIANMRRANRICQQNFDAPETLGGGEYKMQSDIWSIANVLYWIYSDKQLLFSANGDSKIQQSIKNYCLNQSEVFQKIDQLLIQSESKYMLKQMLHPNPSLRPDINNISKILINKHHVSLFNYAAQAQQLQLNSQSFPLSQQNTSQLTNFISFGQLQTDTTQTILLTAQFDPYRNNLVESFIVSQQVK